jgi:cyclopropane-fatty-acyl-phospholipid synthase
MLFVRLFDRLIKVGSLTVIDAFGKGHVFPGAGGPKVTVRLHDKALHHRLFFHPCLGGGEAYMDGTLTIEEGSLHDFHDLLARNLRDADFGLIGALMRNLDRLKSLIAEYIPSGRARANAAHHYDLSSALYDLFLDADRQYSCAYFTAAEESLECAQDNKKRHVAAKLLLTRPGLRVLDIGSGWGGLALYLARVARADVTGITLSNEQVEASRARAAAAGLENQVRFHLRDYREEQGQYDRIVSIGMFEHVGRPQYRAFFDQIERLLKPDGVALLHTISSMMPPEPTNPWIRKYIFPGGHVPSLSEILPAVERCGMWITDVEILRLHYAETLREWHRRFQAHRDEIAGIYDERFCRMWEFYLAGSEMAFRHQGDMVAQIQLARKQDAVPLTRDYIGEWENRHAGARGVAA